jgi:phosphoribosylanthranilate isomerase
LTKVKICGISEVFHAEAAAEAGADLIGLVFAASPRRVTYDRAKQIMIAVKEYHLPVAGVFVDMPTTTVNGLASSLGLDWVQLSGNESWNYCQRIEKPLIKTLHVPSCLAEVGLLSQMDDGKRRLGSKLHVYLLDTLVDGRYGGTGQAFSWHVARRAATQYRVIVAGGLNPENVGQVVTSLRPWGVDVSSGVESVGAKDVNKIRAFVRAVRLAESG